MTFNNILLTTVVFLFSSFVLETSASCDFVFVKGYSILDSSGEYIGNINDEAQCRIICMDDNNCQVYFWETADTCIFSSSSKDIYNADSSSGVNIKKCDESTTTSTTTTPTTTTSTTTTPSTTATCDFVFKKNYAIPDDIRTDLENINDAEECRIICLNDNGCGAYMYDDVSLACLFSPSSTNIFPDSGRDVYTKRCVESSTTSTTTTPSTTTSTTTTPSTITSTTTTPSTTTSTTTTPSTTTSTTMTPSTTTSTTTTPSTTTSTTTMPSTTTSTTTTPSTTAYYYYYTVLQDTDGLGMSFEVSSLTEDACKTACSLVLECQHYVYETANYRCKLFTTYAKITLIPYSLFGRKISCSSGNPCCYQTVANTSDLVIVTPAITLTQTLASCQDLCMKLANCQAVVFTGSSCKVYSQLTNTLLRPGFTLFLRTNATSTDELVISNVCLQGSCLNPMFHLIAIAVASAILLTRHGRRV